MNRRDEIFEELIREHQGSEQGLPPLKVDLSALDKWWHKIGDWFNDLFSGVKIFPESQFAFAPYLAPLLGYAIIITVVSLAIYFTYLYLKKRNSDREPSGVLRSTPILAADLLDEEIELALKNGDWAKAMRAYWKLFVHSTGLQAKTTLKQYYSANSPLPNALDPSSRYPQMYGSERSEQTDYRQFAKALKKILEPQSSQ